MTETTTLGRPTLYTEELAKEICRRISEGESLRAICLDDDMPGKSTVFEWLDARPEFADQYARARGRSADSDADDIAYYARQTADGVLDPAAARAAMDGLKWTSARKDPKKYGDKAQHEHSGPGGGAIPLNLESLTDAQLDTLIARFRQGGVPGEPGG